MDEQKIFEDLIEEEENKRLGVNKKREPSSTKVLIVASIIIGVALIISAIILIG